MIFEVSYELALIMHVQKFLLEGGVKPGQIIFLCFIALAHTVRDLFSVLSVN